MVRFKVYGLEFDSVALWSLGHGSMFEASLDGGRTWKKAERVRDDMMRTWRFV